MIEHNMYCDMSVKASNALLLGVVRHWICLTQVSVLFVNFDFLVQSGHQSIEKVPLSSESVCDTTQRLMQPLNICCLGTQRTVFLGRFKNRTHHSDVHAVNQEHTLALRYGSTLGINDDTCQSTWKGNIIQTVAKRTKTSSDKLIIRCDYDMEREKMRTTRDITHWDPSHTSPDTYNACHHDDAENRALGHAQKRKKAKVCREHYLRHHCRGSASMVFAEMVFAELKTFDWTDAPAVV